MKAPVCFLCHKYITEDGGGDVYFSDYAPLPEDMAGHPHGWEFFCKDHLAAAQALSHLTEQEALDELHKQFGVFQKPWEKEPEPKKSFWSFLRRK